MLHFFMDLNCLKKDKKDFRKNNNIFGDILAEMWKVTTLLPAQKVPGNSEGIN